MKAHPRMLHPVFYLAAPNVIVAAEGSPRLEHLLVKGAELIDALRALTDDEVNRLIAALSEAQKNELKEFGEEWQPPH